MLAGCVGECRTRFPKQVLQRASLAALSKPRYSLGDTSESHPFPGLRCGPFLHRVAEDKVQDGLLEAFERWRRTAEGEHHGLKYRLKTMLFSRRGRGGEISILKSVISTMG